MVAFVPKINPTNSPEYLGMSRSPSAWEARMATDDSAGTGLKGLGNLIGEGSKGFVDKTTLDIRDQIEQQVTPVRDAAGAGLTTQDYDNMTGHPPSAITRDDEGNPLALPNAVPGQLQSGLDSLGKLRAAAEGNVRPGSSSHYYTQINALTKTLKSQYPGFSDIIDNEMQKFTGVNPANALRQASMRDIAFLQEKSAAADNKLQAEYDKRASELQVLHPDGLTVDQFKADPQKYMLEADKYKGQVEAVKNQKAQLDLDLTQGKVNTDKAARAYTAAGNLYVQTTVSGTLNQLQKRGQALISQGADANPTEFKNFVAQAQSLQAEMESHLDNLARTSQKADGSDSYGVMINDPAKLAAAKEEILQPIKSIIAAAGAKDLNAMNLAGKITAMQGEQDFQRLTAKFPGIRAYKAIERGLGPQVSQTIMQLSNGEGILEPLTQAVKNAAVLNVVDAGQNGTAPPSISDQVDGVVGSHPRNVGGAVRRTVQDNIALIGAEDPKVAKAAIQAIYGDTQFFGKVDRNQQIKAYHMLADPEVTKKVVALNDPQALDTYVHALTRYGVSTYKQGVGNLQQAHDYKGYTVQFNPDQLSFTATSNQPDKYQRAGYGDPAKPYVEQVNQLGAALAPALKAKYGKDAPQAFLQILKGAGYNENAPQHGTWLQGFGEAVVKTLGTEESGAINPEQANKVIDSVKDDVSRGVQQLKDTQGKQSGLSLDDTKGLAANAPVSERWKYAYDSFTAKGWTPEQSAGIIGSLAGETGTLNPDQKHDGGIGLGIAGWNKERLTGLKAFAKERGADFKDVDTQLAFVDHELRTTEKAAGDRIRQASTPEEAAAIFTHLYERPGIPNTRARMGNAVGFYSKFAKG